MRTFDKLIATIHTGQGNGGLRPPLGQRCASAAAGRVTFSGAAVIAFTQALD